MLLAAALHWYEISGFGAVSTTALFGDFLSGCLVLFASLFMVIEISFEFETQRKGAGLLGVCALDTAGESRLRFGRLRP